MRRHAATIVMLIACVAAGCSASFDVELLDAGDRVAAGPAVATTTPVPTTSATEPAGADDADDAGAATPAPDGATTPAPAEPTAATGEADGADPTVDSVETPTPAPTEEPAVGPTATSEPTATPTSTATPTPTPEPVVVEFVIGPYNALLGVELDTPAEPALAAMIAAIGDPDFDSGWYVGCPLDGDGLNERLVQWGDLNVYFDRFDDDPRFRAWGYDLRIVDGGFPTIDDIQLPGGGRMGEPVNVVAAAAQLDVVYDEVFDINRVGVDGFEIVSDAPPGAPVWGAFVPAIPACE